MTTEATVHISISASSAALALAQAAALGGALAIEGFKEEDLLLELRQRFAKKNMVIKIMPFAEEENDTTGMSTNAADAPKPAATKPVRATAKKAEAAKPAETPPAANATPEATDDDNGDWGGGDGDGDAPEPITKEAVLLALDGAAAVAGKLQVRTVMEKHGSFRFKDIPEANWSALVEELQGLKAEAA